MEKVREELRVQKELNEQQQLASSKACVDIVGQMESIMENELQCGICSELMVFVSTRRCTNDFPHMMYFLFSIFVGYLIELHAYLLPILRQTMETEQGNKNCCL